MPAALPLKVSRFYVAVAVAPHGSTVRWTYTVPAARFFRMRRSVSLLVADRHDGTPCLIEGTYQSPILVQWQRAASQTRVLDVTLTELR